TRQFVGDDDACCILQAFQECAKKSFGSFLVASTLHQDVKPVSILIDRSPESVLLATNRENHLIQMPFVSTARTAATPFIGVGLSKLQAPLPADFKREDDPPLGHHLFNISIPE